MMIPHIEGDAILIKHSKEDKINGHLSIKPKIVILAGNGSVKGGTKPLCDTLIKHFNRNIEPIVAASMCSILAHEFKTLKLFTLKDIGEIIENVGSIDTGVSPFKQTV